MDAVDECASFLPADSEREAISRIFALTGRAPDHSRGEKRALVALRDALNLDVELARTNPVLGAALAQAVGVEWVPSQHTLRNSVTLSGLNILLEGATAARCEGALRKLRDSAPKVLTGPTWATFRPARSKIEAVTRIAALTDAPKEWLGRGGKEHKSVLLNLADRALPDVVLDLSSKTRLGASLASEFGVPWTGECESTGETISLTGLNMLLAGAERRLGRLGTQVADALVTAKDEGDALAAALQANLPTHWEGRTAVKWLADRGLRGAHDNEWQGFYGEERAKLVLASAFTPPDTLPKVRYGNTPFDYALNYVWDIKVHTETQVLTGRVKAGGNEALLNDERAIRACVDDQGLGFLIISGRAHMDEGGEFVAWHRQFKINRTGRAPAESNSGKSRTRKAAFATTRVESFWVPNSEALDAAILGGALKVRPIGRQPPRVPGEVGAARANKFEMRMTEARSSIQVARIDFHHTRDDLRLST